MTAAAVRRPAQRQAVLEDEAHWLTWVTDAADWHAWRHYHTRRSDRSDAGFLDLVLIRPPRLIFAELKTDSPRSRLTLEQSAWIADLEQIAVVETYVWRPADRDQIWQVLT